MPVLNQAEFRTLRVYSPKYPLSSLQHVTPRFWDSKPVSVLTHSWQGCKAGGTEPPCLQPLWRLRSWLFIRTLGLAQIPCSISNRLSESSCSCPYSEHWQYEAFTNTSLPAFLNPNQLSSWVDSTTWSCSFPILFFTCLGKSFLRKLWNC